MRWTHDPDGDGWTYLDGTLNMEGCDPQPARIRLGTRAGSDAVAGELLTAHQFTVGISPTRPTSRSSAQIDVWFEDNDGVRLLDFNTIHSAIPGDTFKIGPDEVLTEEGK